VPTRPRAPPILPRSSGCRCPVLAAQPGQLLTGHLAHEERDGLPLIGVALTAAEWRSVGRKMTREKILFSAERSTVRALRP
jgi:hypothetical protein